MKENFIRQETEETNVQTQIAEKEDSEGDEFIGPSKKQTNLLCKLLADLNLSDQEQKNEKKVGKKTWEKPGKQFFAEFSFLLRPNLDLSMEPKDGKKLFLHSIAKFENEHKEKSLGCKTVTRETLLGGPSQPPKEAGKMSVSFKGALLGKCL